MISVLYINSTLKKTGPNVAMYNLICKLDRSKFKPYVLTLSPEDPEFPGLTDAFAALNVEVLSLSLSRMRGFVSGTRRIMEVVKKHHIDVIHNYGFRGDQLVRKRDFPDIKIISTINSNIYDDYTMLYGKLRGTIMAWLHMKSLEGKIAVGCSAFVSEQLYKRYHVDMEVINHGIPKEQFLVSTGEKKREARRKLSLPLEPRIFIFVGYLIFRKDPLTVIHAFLASAAAKDAILLVLGEGPLMKECERVKGDHHNIIFTGQRADVPDYLAASDYYISSAFSEGLPLSVMEAMGSGLPAILSDIRPHRELTTVYMDWEYLFPERDAITLAEKMDKVVKDDYEYLSSSCRGIIENYVNSDVMAGKYCQLYMNPSALINE